MTQEMTKTFDTPEGCDLVIKNVEGKIEVTGWDKPQTQIIVVKHSDDIEVEISQDGRKVIAKTKSENGFMDWVGRLGKNKAVDYTVCVPHSSNIKVKCVTGPIRVAEVKGAVRVENVDGQTDLDNVSGEVEAKSVNGALKAANLNGSAKLNAVNGTLKVQGGALDALNTETVNGTIKIDAALSSEGHYSFKTVNGNCHLNVQEGFRARVSAHGVNLHVKCTQPAQTIKKQFGSWQGTIGSGDGPTAHVSFHTVNGSLHINNGTVQTTTEAKVKPTAEAEPTAPPPPPPPPPPPAPSVAPVEPVVVKVPESPEPEAKSKAEILQMVERGEISVDEALELLKQ